MKKRIQGLVTGLILGTILTTTVTAIAANFQAVTATYPILIDGVEFKSENPPVVIDGRTYLPLRAIGEALGVKVDWNGDLSRVEISKNSVTPPAISDDSKLTLDSTFEFDGFEITFGKAIEWTKVDNQFHEYNGREVFKVPVTIKNINDKTSSLNMFYIKQFEPKGTEIKSFYTLFDDNLPMLGELRPNTTGNTFLYFLYEGDGTYYAKFENFKTTREVEIPIKK